MTILPLIVLVIAVASYYALAEESNTVDVVPILAEACRIREAERLRDEIYLTATRLENDTEKKDDLDPTPAYMPVDLTVK